MNNIIPFNFKKSPIRVVQDDSGEPLFVVKDVMSALGYSIDGGISKYIKHVPDEWKGGTPISTPGGTQEMAVLTEQGLYFFVSRSDKEAAIPFQKWIAGDVIPSIRKTGTYTYTDQQYTIPTPHLIVRLLWRRLRGYARRDSLSHQAKKAGVASTCIG